MEKSSEKHKAFFPKTLPQFYKPIGPSAMSPDTIGRPHRRTSIFAATAASSPQSSTSVKELSPSSAPPRQQYPSPKFSPMPLAARPFSPGHIPAAPRRPTFTPETCTKFQPWPCTVRPSRRKTHPIQDYIRQDEALQRFDLVLANRENFVRSAAASFAVRKKETQEFFMQQVDVQALIERLILNLQLPPLENAIVQNLFRQHDTDKQQSLDLSQFQSMVREVLWESLITTLQYWKLLHIIKERFYPSRKVKIRRSVFIGERNLSGPEGIRRFFKFVKRLGAGTFGEVFLVTERSSGFDRVCKIIHKNRSKDPIEQTYAEIQVLKRLDHPNIIKVYEVYQDYTSIYIIMELCDGGELAARISKTFENGYILTERYVADIMRQLLEAVNYFHTEKIAHKDLKPENILFQSTAPDSPIKVIDFGLAEFFERREDLSVIAAGTYLYMAPEVLDYVVSLKCDIWSAGCIMFQLFTGEVPFSGATIEAVEYKLRHEEVPFHKVQSLPVSDSALDLLRLMLNKDYRTRLSAHDVPQEICNNLKKYRRQSNLKNVLTNMLAHQLNVSGIQIRRITEIFRALDADGNGYLSKLELRDGLRTVGFSPHEITQVIRALDVDGSDTVSYTEFLAACYSWRESELNVVWTAFNKLDLDGDGKITVDEFVQCMTGKSNEAQKNAPGSLTPVTTRIASDMLELRRMVRAIDTNNDGIIDWDEFLRYMRS